MARVIIIGAGIAGLATANLLAKAGYEVVVYERLAGPGGRAGTLQVDGFTFDTGPSWYLMPEVFEHYFELLDEDIAKYLQLERLTPAYKVFFEDASAPITVQADLALDRQSFDAVEPGSGRQLERYLKQAASTYQAAVNNFLYTNFQNKLTLLTPRVLGILPRMGVMAATPIDRYVGRYFKHPKLRQIMEYPMVFLGTSPFEAPAIYSLMSHMDFGQGVYYPRGGMYRIIEALVAIGNKLGVKYHYGMDVSRITHAGGKATGIGLASGKQAIADIVISAADLHFTETKLLDTAQRTYDQAYWDRKQAGPSALLLYLGVNGSLPQLEHHNLLFASDWQANFAAIFKAKIWPEPASIYICKPSQTDSSVAPDGCENVFVLVPAPAGVSANSAELESLADRYLEQIEIMAGIPDLRKRLTVRRVVGPDHFGEQFNSWQNTALGLSHRLDQSALFRPANKSKKLNNLYYVGGNTTPGIGLPMCLIGAELVYKRLAGDTSHGPLSRLRPLVQPNDVPSQGDQHV